MKKETIALAESLYVATIAAHYKHGLRPGERLNFAQIAGESVEAAIRFNKTVDSEEARGTVTAVIEHNDAHLAGYATFHRGETDAVPEGMRADLKASWLKGYRVAEEEAAKS